MRLSKFWLWIMSLRAVILIFCSLAWLGPVHAANKCYPLLASEIVESSSRQLTTTFGQQARANGLRYLLRVVPAGRMMQAFENAQAPSDIDLNTIPGMFENNIYGYDSSLIGLYDSDHGKFIQHTIAQSSSRRNGFEKVDVDEWFVGFIFPVEILDEINFKFYAKKNPHVMGPPDEMSSEDFTPNQFGAILKWVLDHPKAPGTAFAVNPVRIVPASNSQLHVKEAVLTWLPAPLLLNYANNLTSFPGSKDLELPTKGQPFFVQIGKPDPTDPSANVDGWVWVKPMGDDFTFRWFDPSLRIGTWYQAMPNWASVEATLKKTFAGNQPLLIGVE